MRQWGCSTGGPPASVTGLCRWTIHGHTSNESPTALTHVLVHVEGFHVLEGKVPVPAVLHQLLVAAQRRAACGGAAASGQARPGQAGSPRPRYPPVGSPSVKNRPGPGPKWTMRLRMYLAAHSLACAYVSRMTSFMAGAELKGAPLRRHLTAAPITYLPACPSARRRFPPREPLSRPGRPPRPPRRWAVSAGPGPSRREEVSRPRHARSRRDRRSAFRVRMQISG